VPSASAAPVDSTAAPTPKAVPSASSPAPIGFGKRDAGPKRPRQPGQEPQNARDPGF
jgi:hypothetical protein